MPVRFIRSIYMLTAAVLFWSPALPGRCDDAPEDARVVAEVNGAVITRVEFDLEITARKKQIEQQGKTVDPKMWMDIQEQSLESLINSELFYQESLKKGITVDASEIEFQIESVRKQFMDDDGFENMLCGTGMTEMDLRLHFEKAVAVERLIKTTIFDESDISADTIKRYYDKHADKFKIPEKVRVSQILIPIGDNPSPAEKITARKQIESIEAQLKTGKDFGDPGKGLFPMPQR